MTIYSPSQTSDWTTCPVYWDLTRRQGWKPRRVTTRDMAPLLGQVAADVLAHYNTRKKSLRVYTLDECLQRAWDTAGLTVALLQEQYDCTFEEYEPAMWLTTHVQTLITKYHAAQPLAGLGWTIEHVEYAMPDHGNARIDLGGVGPSGRFVADYKVMLRLWGKNAEERERNVAKRLEEYTNAPQMLHYTWAYSAVTGEPVATYYIILIVLEPAFKVYVVPYTVERAALARWLASAEWKWLRMANQERGEPLWEGEHFTKYGRCSMWSMCFEGEAGKALYTQRKDG